MPCHLALKLLFEKKYLLSFVMLPFQVKTLNPEHIPLLQYFQVKSSLAHTIWQKR